MSPSRLEVYRRNAASFHANNVDSYRVYRTASGMNTMPRGRRLGEHHDQIFCFICGDSISDAGITALTSFHRQHVKLLTVTAVGAVQHQGPARAQRHGLKSLRKARAATPRRSAPVSSSANRVCSILLIGRHNLAMRSYEPNRTRTDSRVPSYQLLTPDGHSQRQEGSERIAGQRVSSIDNLKMQKRPPPAPGLRSPCPHLSEMARSIASRRRYST
jgi:hypothetical protein